MDSTNHPYYPGAELMLSLQVTRPSTSTEEAVPRVSIRVRVLHAYDFTQSQTLKVEVLSVERDIHLPEQMILKLYDRRFLGDRIGPDAENPWNPRLEEEAEGFRRHIREATALAEVPGLSQSAASSSDVAKSTKVAERRHRILVRSLKQAFPSQFKRWQIENWCRAEVQRLFQRETEAYSRLQSLQGDCIPTLYGVTSFAECDGTAQSTGLDMSVRGILLEYIDGMSLEEAHVRMSDSRVGRKILDIFKRVYGLGVRHNDVRPANIMLRKDGEVFLIDFAQSIL